jgi:pimeloyl-ACP methyl ester carboxylesterase
VTSAPVLLAHTADGKVGYRSVGTGTPLVMVMGFGGTMQAWDPRFVAALAQHHRVIIFDNAGIGLTSALPGPLTISAMAAQTSDLITALHLDHPVVLGWSMGGMIAQALAVTHPNQVSRLVLCATFPGTAGDALPVPSNQNGAESGNPAAVLAELFPTDQAPARDAYVRAILGYPTLGSVPKATMTAQLHALTQWWQGADPAGPEAAGLTVPTLVADGTDDVLDPVANDRTLARLIKGSQLVLYPDAGHAFLFQDEGTFVPRLERFLAS